MPKLDEEGVIAQVLVLLLLAAGLIGGLFLVQHPTFFKPKASELKPASAETSFTLQQESCGTGFWGFKGTCPKDNIKVSLYARSDIDAANLFAAKLKFPTDLLEVVSIDINRNRVRTCFPPPKCEGGILIHGDPSPDDPNQCPSYICRPLEKCPPAPDCQGGTLIHGDPDPEHRQCPSYSCQIPGQACDQAITRACDPKDPENCWDFSTSCAVPAGWVTSPPVDSTAQAQAGFKIGMADPASVYCKEQGGDLSINNENGGIGTCKFPDGRTCDEWAFYRTKTCGDNSSGFIKNWLDQSYDNDSGTISLVGGIPDPGYQSNLNQESQLMASIVFRAKKEGQGKITFGDDSAIYSNRDNINILTIKRDLDIDTSTPKETPSPKPGGQCKVDSDCPSDKFCGGFKPCIADQNGFAHDCGQYCIAKPPPKPTPSAIPTGNGDLNNDSKVDLTDASTFFSKCAKRGVYNQPASAAPICDLNKDGKINAFDLATLLRILVANGSIKSPKVPQTIP